MGVKCLIHASGSLKWFSRPDPWSGRTRILHPLAWKNIVRNTGAVTITRAVKLHCTALWRKVLSTLLLLRGRKTRISHLLEYNTILRLAWWSPRPKVRGQWYAGPRVARSSGGRALYARVANNIFSFKRVWNASFTAPGTSERENYSTPTESKTTISMQPISRLAGFWGRVPLCGTLEANLHCTLMVHATPLTENTLKKCTLNSIVIWHNQSIVLLIAPKLKVR